MKRFLLTLLALAPLAGLFTGCTTVQETGRSQVMLISPSAETQMGLDAFSQIKQEEKILKDPAVNARIQRIGKRIAASVGRELPNAQWEFVVFDAPGTLNAFALPGGKVGVYTGLINLAESDDEIAVVIGHEIAHVTSRHGGERYSQNLLAAIGGAAVAIGTKDDKNSELYLLAYGAGSTLTTLAYSRSHETEADSIGLRFAASAGYDPRAGATFWKKMAAKSGGGAPPKWLSTHPPTGERIANLQRLAVPLIPTYEAAKARYESGR